MAEIVSLAEAITANVHDGDIVAMEGFTHLIPHAAGHELIRQRRRDLTLVRMTPDVIYDQVIGAGCARKLIFSWAGNPGVGSLHRFRDAVENGWPAPPGRSDSEAKVFLNRLKSGPSTTTSELPSPSVGDWGRRQIRASCWCHPGAGASPSTGVTRTICAMPTATSSTRATTRVGGSSGRPMDWWSTTTS